MASTSTLDHVEAVVDNDEGHAMKKGESSGQGIVVGSDSETTGDSDTDDPIIAEYDVYINEPEFPTYILQYIDRPATLPLTEAAGSKVLEMRVKPESGFFEVDVALNIRKKYDRVKGVRFGEATRKSKGLGQQGYGMAAGFERVMPRPKRRGPADDEEPDEDNDQAEAADAGMADNDDIDKYVRDFEDANEKGHVFNIVTYGGRVMPKDKDRPNYMIGVFRGKECHMHKVEGIVRLSTEYHHFDAIDHLDVIDKRKQAGSGGAQAQEPKAVVASTGGGGGEAGEEDSWPTFLRKAAAEPWQRLRYHDENSPESWQTFNDRCFLHDTENAAQLVASLTNEEYAEAISAVKGARVHSAEEDDELFGTEDW